MFQHRKKIVPKIAKKWIQSKNGIRFNWIETNSMKTDNKHNYFICRHCRKKIINDPRIRVQHYCSSPVCQQSRKNSWEREKLRKDPVYSEKREQQKSQWRKLHKTDGYQSVYRSNHPQYREKNQKQQHKRNVLQREIVKTDVLISKLLNSPGVQMEIMRKKSNQEKIVKTDALIAVIKIYQGIGSSPMQKTG